MDYVNFEMTVVECINFKDGTGCPSCINTPDSEITRPPRL